MKRYLILISLALLFLLLPVQAAESEMQGVWVSTVYNLDYPSRPGLTEQELKNEADAIIQNSKNWGLSTIFLQVRPAADALYQSEIAPWSAYLSGTQGQAAHNGFDPLAYFIERCHAQGLELHAWLNPYRVTRAAADSRESAFAQLCETHPAHALSDYVVYHTDGCLYYDPGYPEVQQHLLNIAAEILDNYAVDGIHLDDYFYPGSSFSDWNTYQLHGDNFIDVSDFRREAVCTLVDGLHRLVEEKRPEAQFGVSPVGIWASSLNHPMGSDTIGSQSFFEHYADSRRWVREGMVDYIMPQIYWEIGSSTSDFSILLDWWSKTVADTQVKLYIGIAAYKSLEAESGSVWYGTQELQRQLDAIHQDPNACGAVYFRYGSLAALDTTSLLPAVQKDAEPAPPRVSNWPKDLTLEQPQGNQAVCSGNRLAISCTAPRYSDVTVFYGSYYTKLRSDCNGNYSGWLTAETPYEEQTYTAPALVCSEKFGILTVKLTPFTLTSVTTETPVSIDNIDWFDEEDTHTVIFHTNAPVSAVFSQQGDVFSLTFSPADMGVLFHDDFFARMSIEQRNDHFTYRLVFPDDGQRYSCSLAWAPDSITLRFRKNLPEHPETLR